MTRHTHQRVRAFGSLVSVLAMSLVLTGEARAQQIRILNAQTVAALTARPDSPQVGATHPDVLIVEYFDYNCPYCKAMAPEERKLLQHDPRVAILFKQWPIVGGASIYAAQSALAANWQGKFLIAHDALINAPHDLDRNADVDQVLRSAGLDMKRLEADRRQHATEISDALARSERETSQLGLRGTPALLVGRSLISSALTLPQLQQLVAQARVAGH